jgi:hypothetical protein
MKKNMHICTYLEPNSWVSIRVKVFTIKILVKNENHILSLIPVFCKLGIFEAITQIVYYVYITEYLY